MSIAALSISEGALAVQTSGSGAGTTGKKPPKTRQVVAKADVVTQPEAR